MPFYERGATRIHYEEVGSGFPLMIIPGGGLNSSLASLDTSVPFNPMKTFRDDFRCIAADLRNANGGQSSGPLEIDRPVGRLLRRPAGADGPSRHRKVRGHWILHRGGR